MLNFLQAGCISIFITTYKSILISQVKQIIQSLDSSSAAPKEAWCAAHLNMLCNSALEAYNKYGVYNDSQQRGFLINYDSLPGSVARLLLPSFGVEPSSHWLSKMAVESKSYSKGRGDSKIFFGDSEDKDERATSAIQLYSTSILKPTYDKMAAISANSLKQLSPSLFNQISTRGGGDEVTVNWGSLRDVPVTATQSIPLSTRGRQLDSTVNEIEGHSEDKNGLRGQHSASFKAKEFLAWAPFSNTHSSKPVEVCYVAIFCCVV